MRAHEFLIESKNILSEALTMREYAHPEEFLIRDGVNAAIEILEEFKEDLTQPETLNLKWDGKAAIYWGRDETGQFYMVPNNQWNKGQKLDRNSLSNEIKKTGRKLPTQSDEEFSASREQMAISYERQWFLLEKSSPRRGFFWGDIMFDSPPDKNDIGVYEFTPNKVTYYADPKKELGQAIEKGAKIFITVHGLVKDFGVDPTSQLLSVSQSELETLNRKNPQVYLLSERPQKFKSTVSTQFIDQAISILTRNKFIVDTFINYTAPKFTGFKSILRDYVNSLVKNRGKLNFGDFLSQSKLSSAQQALALSYTSENAQGFNKFLESINVLLSTKNEVFEKLQEVQMKSMQDRLGISSSIGGKPGGEGFAKIRKSGAGIKYVNPEFRSAPVHARFGG
jgi:hypothetical protein